MNLKKIQSHIHHTVGRSDADPVDPVLEPDPTKNRENTEFLIYFFP